LRTDKEAAVRILFLVSVGILLLAATTAGAESPSPQLRRQGTATQLIVDGKPFLIRGGELGNSSASNPAYLRPFWARFADLNMNTILAPVYWELIEPEEGRFDFSSLDGLVADARGSGMRLVLLWFGSWKNSMSCYTPAWVKRDPKRFPRATDLDGTPQEILSPFSTESRDADARAFAALQGHLREIDEASHTVLMVQVENEIGMIPTARDHRPEAERAFASAVPAELMATSPLTGRISLRSYGRCGSGPGATPAARGRTSSVPGRRGRRSSWRGTSRATWRSWPRPARWSTPSRCS
jgi:beta-galactosidase GanA